MPKRQHFSLSTRKKHLYFETNDIVLVNNILYVGIEYQPEIIWAIPNEVKTIS